MVYGGGEAAFGELTRFRHELYRCLTARADALFELTDAGVVYRRPGPFPGGAVVGAPSTGEGMARTTTGSTMVASI